MPIENKTDDTAENFSPEEKERNKSKEDKARDLAYTTNHAVVCTLTDFIDPYVGNFIQKKLGNESQLKNVWAAEFIGDFGAIPVTIGMQRFFPNMMHGISKLAEPVLGKGFRAGAERDAKDWAIRHGFTIDSKEYKERYDRIYNYEINHIPQAIMWTVSSVVLNVAAQKGLGNKAPVSHIALGKVGGAVLTAGLVIGGRSIFPRKAEKIDKYTSKNILLPIEEKIDDFFGLDKNKKSTEKDWSKRVKDDAKDASKSVSY